MIRYAVEVINTASKKQSWAAIGIGLTTDRQDAHLYTRRQLAEKKMKDFADYPVWCESVKIVEVDVSWP